MLEEEDGLNALSELSLLEHLAVYSYGFVPQSHTQLSDHSFPSLRYLNLNLFSQMEADWTLLRLRNLLKGLTTLKVLISNPFGLPSPRWFTESLLPALAHATYLEHLAVDFPDRPYRGAAIEVENMSALSVLSRLPLTTVRFSPIGLQRVDASVAFEAVWSKVTYLDLPETNISLKGLPLFTRFPMLEHLVIQLYIDPRDLPEDGDLHETTGSCLHTLEGGKFSETEHCEDKDTQLQIARFLLSLWPTLNQVLWPKIVDRGVGASRQRRVVKSLNRELRALKNK
ncbi:hypothetical protein FRC12_023869 [Ceratobasidium sp. 428]|nr:hypothetical protein FRC12_023869 [Ceratobasidium sp. 428]